MSIAFVLLLLLAAIILFSTERFTVDVVTIGLLVALMASGILTPAEAFSGFGSDFIMILASIFVITGALRQTGILDLVGSRLLKIARMNPAFLLTYIMATVGFTSAFMNNTTVTAVFIAPVMAVARKMKISPSRLLMPVAYASILGGTCTLIGTSTNVAVNGYLHKQGIGSLGMFDFLNVGLVLFGIGLLYSVTIGRRLFPDRKDTTATDETALRSYISEIIISPESPLIGQKIFKSNLSRMGFRILNVIRSKWNFLPDATTEIQGDDILLIEGKVEDLIRIKETEGIDIRADALIREALQNEQIRLAEVLVTPQSEFVNMTLKRAGFRQRYGLVVLAINRYGQQIREMLGNTVLHVGDILLVQGPVEKINYLKANRDITVMEDFKPLMYRKRKGILTIVLFVLSIIAGTTGILPLSAALMLGTLLIVVSKAIPPDKAYESIDWRLLIMIGGMSAFGLAMSKTGAAAWLSGLIVTYLEPFGIYAILFGFIALTVFLTQPMSNAAAALVVLPVALEAASQLGANPMTFAVAIMMSASVSLVTPFEPSCILVYGPGKYRFADFVRAGSILTIVLMVTILLLVPYYWPLYPNK